jgi:hypothetical protein
VGINCKNPDSLALVGSTDVGSGEHKPCSIIPCFGQVPEYDVESPRGKEWGVFHECESRSYFANDSVHFFPESRAGTGDSFALSCATDILAGEAAADDIDESAPRLSVEGGNVVPDGEWREESISLSLQQALSRVFLNFHCADRSPAK